jgi:alpha-glucosidase
MAENKGRKWWEKAVFYHIYPMSFNDSNADGVGDIAGIITKLSYLQWLGIDTIWLSPVYTSPLYDNGYDISDFKNIDPIFGSMKEFDQLLKQCHSKGMHLMMDFVSNHTSIKHPWFKESRSSKQNDKRDWFIWADPNPNGGPPNNWVSTFGGSGWEYDEKTTQYYYHSFLKEQPDLNWRNLDVQEAMHDVMRFWLEKGVDGFRVDVMWYLLKDEMLRNNPPNPNYTKDSLSFRKYNIVFSTDQPGIHDIISKMRSITSSYGEKPLYGEVHLPPDQLVAYYGAEDPGAHMPGNFLLLMQEWNAEKIYEGICEYEASIPKNAWPNWVLSTHDVPRVASRLGREQALVAAFMLLMNRGTPIIYYGDEIGMHIVSIPKDEIQDRAEQARDPQRNPMQWTEEKNAGFTKGRPWMKISEDYKTINVEKQKEDPTSQLHLYRNLIALKKKEPALLHGSFIPVDVQDDVLAFIRKDQDSGDSFLVMCNLGHSPAVFEIPNYFSLRGRVVLGTHAFCKDKIISKKIILESDEAFVAKLDK